MSPFVPAAPAIATGCSGVAEEIGAGENRGVQSATDRNPVLTQGLSRLSDGSYFPGMVCATQPVDPHQLARWMAMRRPSVGLPPGMWSPGWLMHRMLTRGDALRASASSPPRAASDHRSYSGEAAPASSGPGAQPTKMPDWWADVPLELKAAYWHVRVSGGDPLVLVEIAQALGSRASAHHLVDEGAAQATTVANSIALPELEPAVAPRRQGRRTAEHRGGGDSERAARRGRSRGPAWKVEQQLVNDLVAGIVDIHARRPVIAAHARALLAAHGFHYGSDYTRQRLDAVVQSAIQTARARLARARDPG